MQSFLFSRRTTAGPVRRAMAATAALLLAAVIGALPAPAAAGGTVLDSVQGTVEIGRGDPPGWRAASSGDAVAPGDRIRTGRDGRAELVWQGASVRLYGDSLLRLPGAPAGEPGRVGLDGGSGLFDVPPEGSRGFEVHTPDVVVSVKGTRFGVAAADGPADVRVYRGTVGVRSAVLDGVREVLVREGFRSVGGADGPAEIFLLEHADPWDEWASRPAPRRARAAPPARLADRDAQTAVRRTARDKALALAVARRPELAPRLARARAQLREAIRRELRAQGSTDRAGLAGLDPLLDAASTDVERVLRSRFIREVLSAKGGRVDVTVSPDGMLELVDQTAGQAWALDQEALIGVLQGSTPLPTGLDEALNVTDPAQQTEVVTILLGLMGG